MAGKKPNIKNFEKSIEALEQIVQQMEQGDMGLEASLKQFEKGIKLAQDCQQALDSAEQKVLLLTEEDEDFEGIAFELDDEDEDA